jgi:hypothetical protein
MVAARAAGLTDHEIACAIIPATGDPATTNRARRQLARALRERVRRARRATRRGRNLLASTTAELNHSDTAREAVPQQESATVNTPQPYRRRIVEEWYPPASNVPIDQDVEDMNREERLDVDGDGLGDDLDDDHDLDEDE